MLTFLRYSFSLACRHIGGGACLPRFSFKRKGLLAGAFFSLFGFWCAAQPPEETVTVSAAREIIDQLLAFIYSLGHLIGEGIVRLLNTILPSMTVPSELVDPIGLLAILTIFLAVATIAKKLVWIVVIAGWVLILIRLIIVIIQHYL